MSQFLVKNYKNLNALLKIRHSSYRCSSSLINEFVGNSSARTIDCKNSIHKTSSQVYGYRNLNAKSVFSQNGIWSLRGRIDSDSVYLTQRSGFHRSACLYDQDENDNKKDETIVPTNNQPNVNDQNIPLAIPALVALAPIQIPEFLPKVPIIAVSRNPLFPHFIKMLEVRKIQLRKNLIAQN